MEKSRGFAATALWAVALSLMFYGSLTGDNSTTGGSVLRTWALFIAMVALVPSGWLVVERVLGRQEVTVTQIAEVVAALHESKGDVPRLH